MIIKLIPLLKRTFNMNTPRRKFFEFECWNDTNCWGSCERRSIKGFWFKFLGWGLHFSNSPPLFSERNGYTKFLRLPFGYRVKTIKRNKWL